MLEATVMGARLVVRSLWSDAEPTFEYAFDQERIVIGRQKGADVLIPHAAVSLHHVTIATDGSQYVATDPGSTNGTYVNGRTASARTSQGARPRGLSRLRRVSRGVRWTGPGGIDHFGNPDCFIGPAHRSSGA